MKDVINYIKSNDIGKFDTDELLSKHTTFKVGGPAKIFIYPKNEFKLVKLLSFLKSNNIRYKIIGNGSNLIFSDAGFNGVVINLKKFDNLEINGCYIRVGAGYNLMKLSIQVAKLGLAGLEFASGIPGTVGGAVYMNAGAYKSDMGYIVKKVKVLTPDLEVIELNNEDLDFHYRSSFFQKNSGYICLEALIVLRYGKKELLLEIIKDRKQRRIESQPLNYPSAGSVFRNPEGLFAGKLIEDLGLKGYQIGGAMISEKHANFIVNAKKATSEDIKNLISYVKNKVKEEYNVDLRCEQEYVD